MKIISLLTRGQTQVEVVVEDKTILDFFGILESSDCILSYKVNGLTEKELFYNYCGFMKPSGKLVEKFYDNGI